jgi:hypothetical protein
MILGHFQVMPGLNSSSNSRSVVYDPTLLDIDIKRWVQNDSVTKGEATDILLAF